jgi:hypothetical protein
MGFVLFYPILTNILYYILGVSSSFVSKKGITEMLLYGAKKHTVAFIFFCKILFIDFNNIFSYFGNNDNG